MDSDEQRDYTEEAYNRRLLLEERDGDAPERTRYYHGTTVPHLRFVRPAGPCGRVTFPSDTDRRYAYATTSVEDAWFYAEKAWGARSTGIPRVYEVEPTGPVEDDPTEDERGYPRSNFASDVRSREGWAVKREIPMPESMGDPEDWE